MKKTNVNRKFIKGKKKTLKKQRYNLDGGAPIKFDIPNGPNISIKPRSIILKLV